MKLSDYFRGFWTSLKKKFGVANGIATLDANGRIPANMLPSSAMTIVGYLDAANEHTLPDVTSYDPGSEILVTSDGYYNQSTAFTLPAGSTLTNLEVNEANALIAYGYAFTLTTEESTLGVVRNFASDKIVFTNDNVVILPYSKDITASSTPSTVQVPVSKGDVIMMIDKHWIHLDNTSSVTSVNGKAGAVVLTGTDLNIDSGTDKTIKSYIDEKGVKISEEEGNTLTSKTDGLYVPTTTIPVNSVNGKTGTIVLKAEDITTNAEETVEATLGKLGVSTETDNKLIQKDDGLFVSSVDYDKATNTPLTVSEGTVSVNENYKTFFDGLKDVDVSSEEGNTITKKDDGIYASGTTNYNDLTNIPLSLNEGTVSVNENYKTFFDGLKDVSISAETGNTITKKSDGIYTTESGDVKVATAEASSEPLYFTFASSSGTDAQTLNIDTPIRYFNNNKSLVVYTNKEDGNEIRTDVRPNYIQVTEYADGGTNYNTIITGKDVKAIGVVAYQSIQIPTTEPENSTNGMIWLEA